VEGSGPVSRRGVLRYSMAGGCALLGGLFAESAEAQSKTIGSGQLSMASRKIRRVVTGHNAAGESCIVSDELIDTADLWTPSDDAYSKSSPSLWETNADQPLGRAPAGEPVRSVRLTGGSRLFIATIQPAKNKEQSTRANRIGFHPSQGTSYCFILNDEVVFIVDVQEVTLRAGDLLIERSAKHAWRNEGRVPVGMLISTISAQVGG